ncbi:hypothetical protein QNI19_08730 [Cytophagaceae bacterium DM2B3-1]|uniref:Secreted protein n=1 Tax=Xanthocytophaga flava TaxID=3048013 RepID=A0ABT7CH33_9BACT|nr:hypothetical protein [Xanthocytophaga flavus]MDJ1493015.1 hypothetical protein [Xanthocytophaga flavus]
MLLKEWAWVTFEKVHFLSWFIIPILLLSQASSFFACPKNEAKKGTFLRSSCPQAKGQPRGEKIAYAPTRPFVI